MWISLRLPFNRIYFTLETEAKNWPQDANSTK